MTKKRKQRRGESSNPATGAGTAPRVQHSGADPRLHGLFTLTEELIAAAHDAARESVHGELALFDIAQLLRGINALKAFYLLMENSHWEFASGVSRQLFEQLVNMEYLAERPDRLAAIRSFAAYGLMQRIRLQLAEIEHLQRTGRPFSAEHCDLLEGLLQANFDEFKGKPKSDGSINFTGSWSGLPVRQLAERSSNAMRVRQYEQLYREWSTEVHAAPMSMLDSLFRPPEASLDDLLDEGVDKIAQMTAVTLNLFLDLWVTLPKVRRPTPVEGLKWLRRIRAELEAILDLSGYEPPK